MKLILEREYTMKRRITVFEKMALHRKTSHTKLIKELKNKENSTSSNEKN